MHNPNSWYALPNGTLLPLRQTQDRLIELVPVVEDLLVAYEELVCAVKASVLQREEARLLIIRARRQRLGLELVVNSRATTE
jgi:hypothetical protein